MSNSTTKEIPPLTPEQIAEIDALEGREIDYSDIPPLTEKEISIMREKIRVRKLQRAQTLKQAV